MRGGGYDMLVFSQLGVLSLKKNIAVLPALGLAFATLAFSQAPAAPAAPAAPPAAAVCANPTKVAIVSMADALGITREGQKAQADLQGKFQPKKDALDKKQADIQSKQAQLAKGKATMSPEAQAKLQADIDAAIKLLNRDTEDAQAEMDDERGKVLNAMGEKMMGLLTQYSLDNCFAMVLDVSMEQTPVLWAASSANITNDMVKLYDEKYPLAAGAAPAAAPGAAKPAAAPAAGAPKPPVTAAPPPTKKQ